MKKKYFTEEERKEAHRKQSLASYYRSVSRKGLRAVKRNKSATTARKSYWVKKAKSLGLPPESWSQLRNSIKGRKYAMRIYFREKKELIKRRAERQKERYHTEPEYRKKILEYQKKYRNTHRKQKLETNRKWLKKNPEYYRNYFARVKRRDRARIVFASSVIPEEVCSKTS